MKKWLIGGLAALLLGAVALAQVPTLFLTSMIGTEQINVLVPSASGIVTNPQTQVVTSSNLRDTSGYVVNTAAGPLTLTLTNNTSVFTVTTATTATLTMPSAPFDGQRMVVFSTQGMSGTLTLTANTGQTINNTTTTLAANGSCEYVYQASTKTWFRIS